MTEAEHFEISNHKKKLTGTLSVTFCKDLPVAYNCCHYCLKDIFEFRKKASRSDKMVSTILKPTARTPMTGLPGWPFLGQISKIWTHLKLVGLIIFVWPFHAEKVSSEGKYYYFIFFR